MATRVPADDLPPADEDLDAEGETDESHLIEAGADRPSSSSEDDTQSRQSESRDDTCNKTFGDAPAKAGVGEAASQDVSEESSLSENTSDVEHSDAETMGSSKVATRNNCVYCHMGQVNGPDEGQARYLACDICGDNAHKPCVQASLHTADCNDSGPDQRMADLDSDSWRCKQCTENERDADTSSSDREGQAHDKQRRHSSTSRFAKELLPANRGLQKAGAYSVFNELIVNDDPLDGSRSLRKRKASSEQREEVSKQVGRENGEVNEVSRSPDRILAEKVEAIENAAHVKTLEAYSGIRSRSSRKRHVAQSSKSDLPLVTILEHSGSSLWMSFKMKPGSLTSVVQRSRRRDLRRQARHNTLPNRSRPSEAPITLATPFYAFHERENDELKSKPYGGILSDADANTSRTLPAQNDRKMFTAARDRAEQERSQRSALSDTEHEGKARSQKVAGPPSKIKCVFFGGHEIETWYAAPYPEEYSRNRVLYLCEFCLKYMSSDYVAWRHKLKCPAKHPPGDEIYREKSISIFEVDGRKNPVYCQNLCLLAKLFLGSKTLYYDVEPFLFYVMTECDELGCHFVGYFSKEKRPGSLNNVSCILTLPTHQRKGYGNLLISFSYLLTRVESRTGSPEKPLSDMGLVSYRNYWRLVLSYELLHQTEPLSVAELSDRTGMTADDIVAALEGLRTMVRDPVTGKYALRLDYEYFKQCVGSWEAKNYVTINPDALVWTPYIMGRSNLAHYETAPPMPTVAPREDEEDMSVLPEEGVQQSILSAAQGQLHSQNNSPKKSAAIQQISDASQLASQLNFQNGFEEKLSKVSSQDADCGRSEDDPDVDSAAIPPTRYEIFPPISGPPAKKKMRRGGWRGGPRQYDADGNLIPKLLFGSGRSASLQTPQSLTRTSVMSASSSVTRRRTRNAGLTHDGTSDAQEEEYANGNGADGSYTDMTLLNGTSVDNANGGTVNGHREANSVIKDPSLEPPAPGDESDSDRDAEGEDDIMDDIEVEIDDDGEEDEDYQGNEGEEDEEDEEEEEADEEAEAISLQNDASTDESDDSG